MSSTPPLHVVILAAGRGERFAAEGVTVPKPLIEFRGRSLMYHSIGVAIELRKGTGKIIAVTTPSVVPTGVLHGVQHIVEVSETQPGPMASALLALAHIPPMDPVVFMDCDNYFPPTARTWVHEVPIGKNFLVVADKPKGSNARDFLNVILRSKNDSVQVFAEKQELEGYVKFGAGVYGFETAMMFRHYAWTVMTQMMKEPPMSEVTAEVAFGANRGVTAVFAAGWLPIGTPAQLMGAQHAE